MSKINQATTEQDEDFMKITNEQIESLKIEAICHGDDAQAELCSRALQGDVSALAKCARVIDAAKSNEQ